MGTMTMAGNWEATDLYSMAYKTQGTAFPMMSTLVLGGDLLHMNVKTHYAQNRGQWLSHRRRSLFDD